MKRRDSIKAIGVAAVTTAAFLEACKSAAKKQNFHLAELPGRQPFEEKRDRQLSEEKFFNAHEMATIAVLVDIIIPSDEKSGSATDAKVPEFIEFIVKDEPQHQLPMRGGLRWLDVQCLNKYNSDFKSCSQAQREEMVTAIAFPSLATPEMQPGVAFFDKIRDLTLIGFFTSKIGIEDLGYKGNQPNNWTGVPPEVLKQYGLEGV